MIAESSLLLSAVEGKQIAKGEKVTAVVPGVENGIEMMGFGESESYVAGFLRGVLISFRGSAMLSIRSRSIRGTIIGGNHGMDRTCF
jgi:hypothetical protein